MQPQELITHTHAHNDTADKGKQIANFGIQPWHLLLTNFFSLKEQFEIAYSLSCQELNTKTDKTLFSFD